MKESTKGMLLSGLVYPGLGQLLSKHVTSGAIFALGTTVGLIVLFYHLMQRLLRAMDQILPMLADNGPDNHSLKELLGPISAGGWGVEIVCLIGIAVCWLAAIVHAFFIGKKNDSPV